MRYAITPKGIGNPVAFRIIGDGDSLANTELFTTTFEPLGYVLDTDGMTVRLPSANEVLKDLREAKRVELKAARDAQLDSGITYKGMVFDSDRDSITNVFQALQGLQTVNALPPEVKALLPGPIPTSIQWKLKDNTYTDMTINDLIFLMASLSLYKESQFKKEAAKLSELSAAVNEAHIKKVTW